MRDNDIRIVRTHKFKRTTNSNHNHNNIAPNLLDGDFQATGPNQKWAGDISYLPTVEGWLYLAVTRAALAWLVWVRCGGVDDQYLLAIVGPGSAKYQASGQRAGVLALRARQSQNCGYRSVLASQGSPLHFKRRAGEILNTP